MATKSEAPKKLDETVPGGRYLAADGKTFVDAWGKPIEKKAATAGAPTGDTGRGDGDEPDA